MGLHIRAAYYIKALALRPKRIVQIHSNRILL